MCRARLEKALGLVLVCAQSKRDGQMMARMGGCVAEMRRSTTKVVSDAQGATWKLDWRCESSRLRSMETQPCRGSR